MSSYQYPHYVGKNGGRGELRLPAELMQLIFEQNRPTFSSRKRRGVYKPLLVSKYWYNCAISSASIWSKISINPTALYDPGAPARLANWLERSKRHSLAINLLDHPVVFGDGFDIEVDVSDVGKKAASQVLTILRTSANRWIRFAVDTPNSEHVKLIMPALRFAHKLKFISVKTYPSWGPAFDASVRGGGLSSLQCLQLSSIHPRIDALKHYPQLGGHSVTELTISLTIMEYSAFQRMCMEMPNLEKLALRRGVTYHRTWPEVIPDSNDEPLLPRLTYLCIEEGANVPSKILHSNPKLKVLVYIWDQGSLASTRGILATLIRCPKSLQMIRFVCGRDFVNAPEICPVKLAQALGGFPHLEVIDVITNDDSLVQPHVSAITRAGFNLKMRVPTTKVEKEKPALLIYVDGRLTE